MFIYKDVVMGILTYTSPALVEATLRTSPKDSGGRSGNSEPVEKD